MKSGREWLAGTVLAVVGIVLALGMLEAGVRLLHLVPDRFWEPDPLRGVRLIPGSHGWWTQEDREFLVPVQINQQGLRDVEHRVTKPPGSYRILLLGDSFVEALHVPLENALGRVLERQLNAAGATPPVEVISAGVSGYGTASELLYFEQEGRRYTPDLVVLAFYPGNDVKNNSPTLEDVLVPLYAPDGTLERVLGEAKPSGHDGGSLLGRSAAYHYFRQVLLLQHPQLAQRLVACGLLRADAIRTARQRDGIPVDYGVYAVPADAEWETAWSHTEQLLARLQQAVTESGARLVVLIVSARDQVYPDAWQAVLQAHPAMQGRRWDVDAPQHRIEAWCTAHAVPCVAVAPAFRAAAARGSAPLHYHHDGHWTAAGHRLAAGVLAEFLEQHALVTTRRQGADNEGD